MFCLADCVQAVSAAAAAAAAAAVGAEESKEAQHCVVVEWSAGAVDDLVADSVAAAVCQCCVGAWAVLQQPRHQHHEHQHQHQQQHEKSDAKEKGELREEARSMLAAALQGQFGLVELKDDAIAVAGCKVVLGAKGKQPLFLFLLLLFVFADALKGAVRITGDPARVPAVRAVVDRLAASNLLTGIKANIL